MNDLFPEIHHEICGWLKPYSLCNFSLTSKHYHQVARVDSLWKAHLNSEFPYCLEKKGSFLEKYTICKRQLLKQIATPFLRMLVLLLEAKHYDEFKKLLKSHENIESLFLMEIKKEKSLAFCINEQNNQDLREFSYHCVHDDLKKLGWATIFGQVKYFSNHQPTNENFIYAFNKGSIASLEHFSKKRTMRFDGSFQFRAVRTGYLDLVKWILDHESWNSELLREAANYGHTEIISFLLTKPFFTSNIQEAITYAVSNGQPKALEALLTYLPQTTLTLDNLLGYLKFSNPPNETPACLKLLLEKGAQVDTPNMGYNHNVTLLFEACSYTDNEQSIEILLERGADPDFKSSDINFPIRESTPLLQAVNLKNSTYVKLLLQWDATVTQLALGRALFLEEMPLDQKSAIELSTIIDLLHLYY